MTYTIKKGDRVAVKPVATATNSFGKATKESIRHGIVKSIWGKPAQMLIHLDEGYNESFYAADVMQFNLTVDKENAVKKFAS